MGDVDIYKNGQLIKISKTRLNFYMELFKLVNRLGDIITVYNDKSFYKIDILGRDIEEVMDEEDLIKLRCDTYIDVIDNIITIINNKKFGKRKRIKYYSWYVIYYKMLCGLIYDKEDEGQVLHILSDIKKTMKLINQLDNKEVFY